MSRRYSRIREAGQLNLALTNYIQYLTQPRERNVGTRGARPESRKVYVQPFGFDIPTDEIAEVNNSVDGYNALNAEINGAAGAEVQPGRGSLASALVGGFTPARVVWFRNATRSTSVVRSQVTNLQYLKYAGDRFSCAFGRKAAGDDEHDAFREIKTALVNPAFAVNRVSLSREKYRYS